MLLEYVKNGIALYIFLVLFAVSLGIIVVLKYQIIMIKEKLGNCSAAERRMLIKKKRKYIKFYKIVRILVLPLFIITLFFGIQKHRYRIPDHYAWSVKEMHKEPLIEKNKRMEIVKKEMYEKQLHFSWFLERDEEEISQKSIDIYKENVYDLFSVYPDKEDVVKESDENIVILEEAKQNFLSYMNKNQGKENSEDLWKAYLDGVKVCEVWMTSEYIFQTGVLAESAAENDYKSNQKYEDSLYHTGGMLEKFEQFLEYRYRSAGKGIDRDIIISERELAIRIAKRLYRLGKDNPYSDTKQLDMKRHSSLFAYACMMFAVENIEPEDKYYLLSVLYSSLCCLNLMQYIDDEILREKLCQKELNRWSGYNTIEELLSKDMEELKLGYELEENILERIIETKIRLEKQIRQ